MNKYENKQSFLKKIKHKIKSNCNIFSISHNDLDGYGSTYLLSKFLEVDDLSTLNIANINYGEFIQTLETYTKQVNEPFYLIITDLNLKEEEILLIEKLKNNSIIIDWLVIDHHITDESSVNRLEYNVDKSLCATKALYKSLYDIDILLMTKYKDFANVVNSYDMWIKIDRVNHSIGTLITLYMKNTTIEDNYYKLNYFIFLFDIIFKEAFYQGIPYAELIYSSLLSNNFLNPILLQQDNKETIENLKYYSIYEKFARLHINSLMNYVKYNNKEYIIFSGLSTKITQYIFDDFFKQSAYRDKVFIVYNEKKGTLAFRSVNGQSAKFAKLCGGGGHINAAGAMLDYNENSLDNLISKLSKGVIYERV